MKRRICKPNNIGILLFMFFINGGCKSASQIIDEKKACCEEKVVYQFEKIKNENYILNEFSDSIIVFYLFNGFNDTVKVSYGETKFLLGPVFDDTNVVSTKYTGKSFGIKKNYSIDSFQIELVTKQKSTRIILYNYPICILKRENGIWIADYRINKLILK